MESGRISLPVTESLTEQLGEVWQQLTLLNGSTRPVYLENEIADVVLAACEKWISGK